MIMFLCPVFGLGLNLIHLGHFVPGCTQILQSFGGYGSKIENDIFTGMYIIPIEKVIITDYNK